MAVVELEATCRWHKEPRQTTIQVQRSALRDYMNGTLVQHAFPDLTPNEREVIINQRVPGSYMCQDCWHAMGEEE